MSTREIDLGSGGPGLELAIALGQNPGGLVLPRPNLVALRPCAPDAPGARAQSAAKPMRFSRLRLMAESPAHYELGEVEETGPMRKGTALHAFLLGQKDRVAVFRDGVRNAKSQKYKDFQAANPGKHILIPSEEGEVLGMRASVERHRRAMELLEGEQERRIEWDFGGRRCAGTPDSVRDYSDRRRVTELKATWCTKPSRLLKHARWMHWHAQVSWYGEGLDRTMSYPQLPCEDHYVVAVESKKPYPVTVLHVTAEMVTKGARAWRAWWERMENCEASNYYPGYTEADVEMTDDDGADGLDWEDDDAA